MSYEDEIKKLKRFMEQAADLAPSCDGDERKLSLILREMKKAAREIEELEEKIKQRDEPYEEESPYDYARRTTDAKDWTGGYN